MDNRGLMDESQRDRRGDPDQADPGRDDQHERRRLFPARVIAELELGVAGALIVAFGLAHLLRPTFIGGPGWSVSDDVGPGIGLALALVGLYWMVRIYRRSFGYEEEPPPWRSRRPR